MSRARDLAAFVSNADGDVKFDTDTLFIDSSANRVGIGTTTPSRQMSITDDTNPFLQLALSSDDAANNGLEIVMDANGAYFQNRENTPSIFSTNNTERMRIDENGNIGLNEPNPTADIHMTKADDVNEIIMDANRPNAGQLIGRNRYYWNGTEVARMEGDAGSDTTNKDDGYLRFLARASGSSIAEKLRIDSDGLKFNGDTAAANALDDYEEGTWTPVIEGSSIAGTTTYTTQEAQYTKIGRTVHIVGILNYTAMTGSGFLVLKGLPYPHANIISNQNYAVGNVLPSGLNWSSGSYLVGLGMSGTSFIYLYGTSDDGAATAQSVVNESANFRFTMTYTTT